MAGQQSPEHWRPSVVYVAQGSHANFYNPAVYLGRGEQRTGVGCEERAGRIGVSTSGDAPAGRVLRAERPFAWITYQGTWGEQAGGQDNGPTGPNTKRAWRAPFSGSRRCAPAACVCPTRWSACATSALCDIIVFASHNLLAGIEFVPLGHRRRPAQAGRCCNRRHEAHQLRPVGSTRWRCHESWGQIPHGCFRDSGETLADLRRDWPAVHTLRLHHVRPRVGHAVSPIGALTSFGASRRTRVLRSSRWARRR